MYRTIAPLAVLSLAACSSNDKIIPEGMHTHYVANQVYVPTNSTQVHDYGLDLDGNGTIDNQLGSVLGTLVGYGFDIQSTINKAVAEGNIILLLDFQAKDFTNAAAAGLQVYLGSNPMPSACNGGEHYTCTMAMPPVCSGCQHHLDGNGMFMIDPMSPKNAALAGPVASGTFIGGPGNLTLQIALGGTDAITLNLIGARTKASGISATAIGMGGANPSGGAILAGALTADDLNNKVLPAVHNQVAPIVVRDCCGTGNMMGHTTCDPNGTPKCGCMDGTTGKTILNFFDTDNDCEVSLDEIKNSHLISSLLAPDVTINGQMALSLGIKVTAVKGTFSVTGQ
jgi:hypothetical protein